jgi:phosphoribosylformylglycinamidine cyclo-ligase
MSTYKESGVDIDAGEELVRRIKKPVRSTFNKNVLTDIGMFGAFYRADFGKIRKPVLVSSVDGVGTKLKVAAAMGRYETVGQDLVNHCVNDILVCGARPLFFLDYYATGRLVPDAAEKVVSGFVKACRENGCALIGGETAEMPGIYDGDDFDIAGTIVGIVDEKKILNGKKVKAGDVLIGLPSTGLHTNGYSLARRVLLEKYSTEVFFDELGCTLGEALLKVHRSYLHSIRPLIEHTHGRTYRVSRSVHALSHITGGGIEGNTMRILPKGTKLGLDWAAWERPPLFRIIQKTGDVPEADMRRTFNLGIGLLIVADRGSADEIMRILRKKKERPVVIGEVLKGNK